jgi:hypothetical protein
LSLFLLLLSPDPDLQGHTAYEQADHSTNVIGEEGHLGDKKGRDIDAEPYDT